MPKHTPSVRATVAWAALVSVLVVGGGPTGSADAQVPGVLQARPAATLRPAETPSLLIGAHDGLFAERPPCLLRLGSAE